MEDEVLLDAVERYLNGEMNLQEKSYFEDLRKTDADVDQLVVEHQLFLSKLENFGEQKLFKSHLQTIHNHLLEQGAISMAAPKQGAKVVQFWNKYKRTIAVAASIAGITALTISGMTSYITPRTPVADIVKLSREINTLKIQQSNQGQKISEISSHIKLDPTLTQKSAGSSFLIDPKGYLVTNAHVVNNSSTLVVVNNGKEYYAKNIYSDPATDVAILQITDTDFTARPALPYTIRKSKVDLGEDLFTLGYPRNEIVYNKGYMSAATGFSNDDTLRVTIAIDANRGNSGGPVLDKNGDVMGILNSLESNANGVVFANRTINIMNALTKLKEQDSTYRNIKLSSTNSLKGKERTQQIKQISDCVFMVKGYSKQ